MEKHPYGLPRIFFIIIFVLGLVSFVSCIVAEFKTTKKKDIKLDGKLCYLPGSPQAFGFGITALICLTIAQILGNLVICRQQFCSSGENRSSCGVDKKPTISTALLFISWISFGTAIIIISAATSMNTRQHYGKGWLDGKCFIAKEGVYATGAVLVLVTIGSTLGSSITATTRSQVEQKLKIHAQSG